MHLPKKRSKAGLPARRAKPNAMTHGAFSSIQILPWEDPGLFEQLRRDLWEEHKPEGPSQDDCVETILWCRWRKMRLRERRKLETSAALETPENHVLRSEPPAPLFDTQIEGTMYGLKMAIENRPRGPRVTHSAPNVEAHLSALSLSFFRERDSSSVNLSLKLLPEECRSHLLQHVQESNFETTEAWIFALKKEVDTVLLPREQSKKPTISNYKAIAAEFLGSDRMMEDLQVEERLDAAMDRALRRLFWLKAHKELEREKAQKIVNGKVTSPTS